MSTSELACDCFCVASARSRSVGPDCADAFAACDTRRLWKAVVALETGFTPVLVPDLVAAEDELVGVDAAEADEELPDAVLDWVVEAWPALLDDDEPLVDDDELPDCVDWLWVLPDVPVKSGMVSTTKLLGDPATSGGFVADVVEPFAGRLGLPAAAADRHDAEPTVTLFAAR